MTNLHILKKLRLVILISCLLLIFWGSLMREPVYALGPFLRINVTPSNISFNVADAEDLEQYYVGSQKVTVVSQHIFPWLPLSWHLGIRSAEPYLRDSINPNNQIPVSQLRWSRDGQNFQQLSEEWNWVNSYFDFSENKYEEEITYRLYPEPDQSLPAGLYSVRIEFDARWLSFPWR